MGAYHSIHDTELVIEEYSNHRHLAPRWGINEWSDLGNKNSDYWTGKSRFCVIPTEFYPSNNSGWFY